ncbi:MAG: hypothetical protein ABWY78_19500 [Microvirga sp.]
MPRYFFRVRCASELTQDDEGQDLPDLESARDEVLRAAIRIWLEALPGDVPKALIVEILDDLGRALANVRIDDVVQDLRRSAAPPRRWLH